MNKYLKSILIIILILAVCIVCFFIGRNVGKNSNTNGENSTTIQRGNIDGEHQDLDDNPNVENQSFNELTTVLNTNT